MNWSICSTPILRHLRCTLLKPACFQGADPSLEAQDMSALPLILRRAQEAISDLSVAWNAPEPQAFHVLSAVLFDLCIPKHPRQGRSAIIRPQPVLLLGGEASSSELSEIVFEGSQHAKQGSMTPPTL